MTALAIIGAVFGYAAIGGGTGWTVWEHDHDRYKVGFLAVFAGLLWPLALPVAAGALYARRLAEQIKLSAERRQIEEARQRRDLAEVERELRLLDGGR